MVCSEVAEKLSQYTLLFLREIRQIVEFVDITDISKQLISISHVFIDIVEIGYKQLSPAEEMVKSLVNACLRDKALVEVADKLYGISHL